jgi:peptide/nickel transport system ATP-binding protein
MERGTTDQVFSDPQHPYTWGLLTSVTGLDHPRRDRLVAIPGAPPSLSDRPAGCPFEPRCRYADRTGGESARTRPPLRQAGTGQWVACHLSGESRAAIFAEEVQPVL